ncbi:uncharacterized protein LOC106880407 [Octopus bimaculoides]|uniref:uncharacterized protein LOC106880407 n=1 Tax=Octopus bimaculoides TaxID=37653 RepID=UPI00071C2BF2|nr:uncharacterized protein LOC106880407 [Octopus bimaculoides]|eukprot:XP_014785808.1 PREDICTED: uncharacterized protein LOC106880407 [Octopus bimaculoides]
MNKIWYRGVYQYLQEKGLGPKDIYADMVVTLGDDASALSTVKRGQLNLGREERFLKMTQRLDVIQLSPQENIDRFHHILKYDGQLTFYRIAYTIIISRDIVENILHNELGMTKASASWVPHLLTLDQKRIKLIISRENLTLFEADPADFLERFVTEDVCWVHHFEPETKRQSKQRKLPSSPAPNKASVVSSTGKVMTANFKDGKGIVSSKGPCVNEEYYVNLLR